MILDKDRKEDKDKVGIASVPPLNLREDRINLGGRRNRGFAKLDVPPLALIMPRSVCAAGVYCAVLDWVV